MTCFPFLFSREGGLNRRGGFDADDEVSGIQNVELFSYKELRLATEDFRPANKIGEGGFSSVFKGRLKDGKIAAIKVLSAESRQGVKEFLTEINVISEIEHENLVELYGCCVEENHRILVYNYLENNSLAQTLLGGSQSNIYFNWRTRCKICIGVARGLSFLHEEVRPHIVHQDIKASNILLDRDLSPKISGFGLAKLIPPNMTHVSTRVAGTIGYLAPEYAIRGQLTRKADIYSFGVLLVEIVSGRCNTNTRLPIGEQYLLERTWELYEQKELVGLVDAALNGEFDAEQACKFLKIGLLCTQDAPKLRPSMSTVVKMLTGEMEVDDSQITKPGLISDFMDLKVRDTQKAMPETNNTSYNISSGSDNLDNSTLSSGTTTAGIFTFTAPDDGSTSEQAVSAPDSIQEGFHRVNWTWRSSKQKEFETEEIGLEPEVCRQHMISNFPEIRTEPEASVIDQHISPSNEIQLFLMQGGLGLTEPPKEEDWANVKEIYLMDNKLSVLPKNPRCPMLSSLYLQRNYNLRTIPPSFFDYMPALQILNLSKTGIRSLPKLIYKLVNLKMLFLNDCHSFMILSSKVGDLKQLEVLDLEGTEIMDLPSEIKKLTNLTCLKVSIYGFEMNGRKARQSNTVVPYGVISALSQLEELNISMNPDDKWWHICVETIVTEVSNLKRLNSLEFFFPVVELLRHFILNSPMWMHPSLSHFRFTVGHHVKRVMSRLPSDVEFELERWDRCLKYINGVDVPKDVGKVLQHATAFFLERHATAKKLSDFGIGNMEQLKCCVIGECNEVQAIIDGTDACEQYESSDIVSESDRCEKVVLGSLEYMYIFYLKNLRSIWEGPPHQKCLFLLKSLTLRTCPELTIIFTQELLHNLSNLEVLTVEDCPSVQNLVSGEISAKSKASYFLPNLKRVSLHHMPGLANISNGLCIAPNLEWLSIYFCPDLMNPFIEELSAEKLKKIKGERSWWEALEWTGGRPGYLDDIFVEIDILDC